MDWSSPDTIIQQIETGNRRGLSKAISMLENRHDGFEKLLDYAFQNVSGESLTLGITGPPGVGKSTLTNSLVSTYRAQSKTVGVIAVDPTSPYSGGALLGDRVRMDRHASDAGVYIRSLASRHALGGLSDASKLVLYLYKAYKFDIIIIETVGVGQDEIDIATFADITALLIAPGAGDLMQMSKAGIMETADLFVLNKADKPEAEKTRFQLQDALNTIAESLRPPIVKTVADREQGVEEVVETVESLFHKQSKNRLGKRRNRIREEIRSMVFSQLNRGIIESIDQMTDVVAEGKLTHLEAANAICKKLQL